MSTVTLSSVSFAYSDSVALISGASVQLGAGWTGVVGANGAGKTTLRRLIAGELAPEQGAVALHPAGLVARLCPQRVAERSADIDRFAVDDGALSSRVRGQLELRAPELERWGSLSPGERKRWQIGAVLAAEPGLLLLDEPTNHLDVVARGLLLEALRRFQGIGVVVSHDRGLLNELTSNTVRIQSGKVRSYHGSYPTARSTWEREAREQRQADERLRSEEKKLRRRLGERRGQQASAQSRMRTSKRMKSAKDSDARLRFKAKRRRSAEVGLGREISKLNASLERIERQRGGFEFERALGRSLFVDYVPARVPILLGVDAVEIRAGSKLLLENVVLDLRRDSRVRVTGPNGVGKTTLLRHLFGGVRVPRGRLLYLPQELSVTEELFLLESLRALAPAERGSVLSVVAALGVDPEQLLASRRPSPGEARKLKLAFGLGRQVWGLVLDEPTNHLDLPSIERLEDALAAYPGALVMVTHDDSFAARCTERVWALAERRVWVSDAS